MPDRPVKFAIALRVRSPPEAVAYLRGPEGRLCGASRVVPAAKPKRPVSVQTADSRPDARQREGCAVNGHLPDPRGTVRFSSQETFLAGPADHRVGKEAAIRAGWRICR